ncbi:helix-turn-helix domain-containing protein [Rhodoferax sp.]|uniref:helix-turn-helix domain-containing protein n=1 Tax=Rhodoferax sp. TaxID=50421 RepID=UPI002ACDE7F0|nr:helix-turn-helix domain-containing protein [Rhodoferax sp.]MDZ7919242.1 helix-turn-helix domain-containing protein [Rhodoferax sp.]
MLTTVSAANEPPTAQATAGTLLRVAREAAGLHVAALAVSMKVPVKKLEALEADRFDLLPDAVFVRALASSVCRNLKIDPAPVLSLLPHQHAPRLGTSDGGINAPFHAAGESRPLSVPSALKQPVVIVVLMLLAAALGVLFFPELQAEVPPEDVAATSESLQVVPFAQMPAADTPPPSVAVEPVIPAAMVAASTPTALPVASVSSAQTVGAIPEVKAASAPALPSAAGQQVVFRVKGPSWVEVTDAKGAILMRRNLAQGDTTGISGALPLSVVVGRADVTEVEVKGKPFNLAAIAKDNVARFEVK